MTNVAELEIAGQAHSVEQIKFVFPITLLRIHRTVSWQLLPIRYMFEMNNYSTTNEVKKQSFSKAFQINDKTSERPDMVGSRRFINV